jgi:hypothetical protein
LSPQNQVSAGYPIYIQPASLTGEYLETFDFATTYTNVIVTVTWNFTVLTPLALVSTIVEMAISADDITYSAYTAGSSQFFDSFRYLRVKMSFTGADDTALMLIYNLTVNLNVKREVDSGDVAALSTDAGGTEVVFNKAFKDVESITAAVAGTTVPYVVVYDFVDIPDPVHFYVYVFDAAGARVSKTVSWKVRGIV